MKKTILFLLPLCVLASCGEPKFAEKDVKGVIDCRTIEVSNSTGKFLSFSYSSGYSEVYEYLNADGKLLYFSNRFTKRAFNSQINEYVDVDYPIKVYPSRYKSDFDYYRFNRFVGYLTRESNYLLDLDLNIIDSETKYSEYLFENNPNETLEANNPEAYEKAKTGYYTYTTSYDGEYYAYIYLDMAESSMSRHSYIKLCDDCVITYKPKWY